MGNNVDKNNLNVLYEDLRGEVLAGSVNYSAKNEGLALFMHRGMVSWIEAWAHCNLPDYLPEAEKASHPERSLPGDSHAEVATLLANMALGVWQEINILQ